MAAVRSKSICVAVPDKTRRMFRVFFVKGWKTAATHTIVFEDDTPLCDCASFKFERTCVHTKLAVLKEAPVYRDRGHLRPVDASPVDVEQLVRISFTNDASKTVFGFVDPNLPDLSSYELVWLMLKEKLLALAEREGRLSPARICAELTRSGEDSVALIAPSVKTAGKAVARDKDSLPDLGEVVKEKPLESTTPFSPDELRTPIEDEVPESEKVEEAESADEPAEDAIPPERARKARPVGTSRGSVPMWKRYSLPDPKRFYVQNETWEALLYCIFEGKNTLILGPSGSGKSEVVYLAAQAVDRKFEAFNMGAMSEPRLSLIGATHFDKDEGTWFNRSRFVNAVMAEESVLLLDEMTRNDRAAYNILLPLMDRQGYLALDESEDAAVVHKGKGVCFIATANVGMEYTGTEEMDKAMKERFDTIIEMAWPPEDKEVEVLRSRCYRLTLSDARRLVSIATKQRNMCLLDGDFQTQISTRMLIATGEKIGHGMTFDQACVFSIQNHFSGEGGDASERTRIRQIVQKGGGA